jgi:bifunctional DNase/RNase
MDKVELKFLRITYSHTHAGAYALILAENFGDRRLPIIIGGVEAQAIAIQVENIKPARPLTHDLFKNVSDSLGFNLKEVIISDLVEGIFHAQLVIEQDAREVTIDARSSDAIALALRFDCPIFTYEPILSRPRARRRSARAARRNRWPPPRSRSCAACWMRRWRARTTSEPANCATRSRNGNSRGISPDQRLRG